MHADIYAEQIKDYLIFGAPLDIAIAANTKFDSIFFNRKEAAVHKAKLDLVLGTYDLKLEHAGNYTCQILLSLAGRISNSDAKKFLIILDQSLPKFKNELEEANIKFETKQFFLLNGKIRGIIELRGLDCINI